MAERNAVTKAIATHYKRADKAGKARILDELCATTGWHRDHARRALRRALGPRIVRARTPRSPKYRPNVIAALIVCCADTARVGAGARRHEALTIDDDAAAAALLTAMSAATIDRRLAPECKKRASWHKATGPRSSCPASFSADRGVGVGVADAPSVPTRHGPVVVLTR